MRPLFLTPETQAALTRIRACGWTLAVLGMSASKAGGLVRARVGDRINAAGVEAQNRNVNRSYVSEIVKAFRTETGEPLADALEMVVRKWVNSGLNSELLQTFLCDCFLRFEQAGYAGPLASRTTVRNKPGPKSRRLPRRSYERALEKGRASLGRSSTVEGQSASHKAGCAHAAEIAEKLRPVLAAHCTPPAKFVSYFAFAQKLGRLCRRHTGRTRQIAAADIIDLYEAKSLDRDTLLAIARSLFDISPLL